jgi:nucleoside-diphosphate-sugar epimerase
MSTVAIAGGHGKIAMLLGGLLAERGDTVRGLIRKPEQEADLRAAGIEPAITISRTRVTSPPRCAGPTPWSSPRAPGRVRATRARRPWTSAGR